MTSQRYRYLHYKVFTITSMVPVPYHTVPDMGRMVQSTCSHLKRYCRIRVIYIPVPDMGRMVQSTCSHLKRYCRIRVVYIPVPDMGRMVQSTCSHLKRYCRIRVAHTESTSVFTKRTESGSFPTFSDKASASLLFLLFRLRSSCITKHSFNLIVVLRQRNLNKRGKQFIQIQHP